MLQEVENEVGHENVTAAAKSKLESSIKTLIQEQIKNENQVIKSAFFQELEEFIQEFMESRIR